MAVLGDGDGSRKRRALLSRGGDACGGEGKKRRHGEAAPMLPPGRAEEPAPAPRLPRGEADGNKRRPDELAPPLPLGEAEGNKRRRSGESAPLLPLGDREAEKRLPGEPAPLLPFDEADGKKRRAAETVPLLLLGEAVEGKKRSSGEPAPRLSLGDGEAEKRRPSCSGCVEAPPPKMVMPDRAALIAEVVRSNGPPPRRLLGGSSDDDEEEDPVVLALRWRGVERDDRYDPHVDLFFLGRPREDSWNQRWRGSPLVLHDAALVAAIDSVILWAPGMRGRYLDVSEHVTRLLQNHPGPISTLRIDSSEFPGMEQFTRWMTLLSEKQARHVILINLTASTDTEVPLHQLCSYELTYLGIGFVSIRACLAIALDAACQDGHPWCRLAHLSLNACHFLGPDLAHTIKFLWGLRKLRIGQCLLTQGCDEKIGLQIGSQGLICVQFNSCTASTKLVIGHGPAMKSLTLGVRSADNSSPTSHPVHLYLCEGLRELYGISFPYLRLIIGIDCKTKVQSVQSLPCLKGLVATVDLGSALGTQALFSFLSSLPRLERLTISSAHDSLQVPCDDDKADFPPLDSVAGVANSLKHLITRQFTGSRKEVTFICAILAAAHHLDSVAVHPGTTMPMSLAEAAQFFKTCNIVSSNCRIRVGPFV